MAMKLLLLGILTAGVSIAGTLHPDLNLTLSADVRNAYVATTGGMIESNPLTTQCLYGNLGLGDFGGLEGYIWTISALTGQKDDYRDREFNEVVGGFAYDYSWAFARDWSLDNALWHVWDASTRYYDYDKDEITHEIGFIQSLGNPWVTPYYDVVASYHPDWWVRVYTGLKRSFGVLDDRLILTPFSHVIWGDRSRYRAKFGGTPDWNVMGLTPMYLLTGVLTKYRLREHLSLYLRLQWFDVIDAQGRRHERSRDVSWAVCDYPFVVVGLTVDI